MVAISVGYRHYQQGVEGGLTPFDCVADCRAALRHIRKHSEALGVDPARVLAIGDSAGGHLSLMMGFPPAGDSWATARVADLADPSDEDAAGVADAVVSYNPVADFETCAHAVTHVRGVERLSISPVHRLRAQAATYTGATGLAPRVEYPPTLLIHGECDTVCLVEQSQLFAELAQSAWPDRVQYIELAGTQHAFCCE